MGEPTDPNETKPVISFDNKGAVLSVRPKARDMKCYPITEIELDMVSASNRLSAASFSIGSFCASLAVTLGMTAYFQPGLSERMLGALQFGIPFSIVAAIVCFVLGFVFSNKRSSILRKIKEETESD